MIIKFNLFEIKKLYGKVLNAVHCLKTKSSTHRFNYIFLSF